MRAAPPRIVTPREGMAFTGWDATKPIPAPLALHACAVKPEWTDYNGHMSESAYLLVFGDSSDAFFRFFGVDEAYRARGFSLYTVDTRIRYLAEVDEGASLRLTLELLDLDAKRLHLFHRMTLGEAGTEVAAAEQVLLHVDTRAQRSARFPPDIASRLAAIRDAHALLPRHR
ncbi:MAG: thioesterase family protein, partial [Hyphomicrobiales bacterium]|nr:thioesterase family protein [Hyphomicrobiales bacterium]